MTPEAKLQLVLDECRIADGRTVGDAMRGDQWVVGDILRPVFAVGADGQPVYRLAYVELPRGHWKTGGVAAISVAEALVPSTDVVVAAGDREQAAIVLENVDGYLLRNPALGALFQRDGDERYTEQGSRIRVISSDAPTAFGLGGTHRRFRVVAEELTVWPSDALWVALVSATGKVEDSQVIVLSNAGFDAERSWQWEVRNAAERSDFGYLFSASGSIASWITPEWIEQMRELLPVAAFDRLIGNTWTSGAGDFVDEAQWRRCVDERLEPRVRGIAGRHFAGLDLGLTRDRTAMSVVHRDGDDVVLDDLTAWQGTKADPVSIVSVERALLDAGERFAGLRVSADPWQMKGSLERLRGHLYITEFTFSSSSVQKLSATLHHAITSARLRVFPDRELEREILALRVVETPNGWKFDHRAGGFSDRAIALSMAILAAQGIRQSGPMRVSLPKGSLPLAGDSHADRVARARVRPVRAASLDGGARDLERVTELTGLQIYDGSQA